MSEGESRQNGFDVSILTMHCSDSQFAMFVHVLTCDNILGVSRESTVPHPASWCLSGIVALDAQLRHQREIGRPPDLTGLVCWAGGQQTEDEQQKNSVWSATTSQQETNFLVKSQNAKLVSQFYSCSISLKYCIRQRWQQTIKVKPFLAALSLAVTQELTDRESLKVCRGEGNSRGIRAELAAEGVAFVCRDLGLGNELSHLISDASSEVPHITVPLLKDDKRTGRGCYYNLTHE